MSISVKLKRGLQSKNGKVLLSNFFSLSFLQVATYIFPLITLPYLVRVLGIDTMGLLAMATATIAYFQIITDYGFDLSATKAISIHRENREKVIEIFSSVITIKVLLMLVSFFLLSILIFLIDEFRQNWGVYVITYGLVVGQVLFPMWFFQGMERMKYITILTILSKFIFTISIFLFVKEREDYWIVPLLYSLGAIISGLISLYIIRKDFDITFRFQRVETIKIYLKDGWDIFVQRLYVNMYNNMANILILGFLTNNTIVGIYSIATKIVAIIGEFFKIVSRVYYPYFSKKFSVEPRVAFDNLKKISLVILLLSIVSMFLIFQLDETILKIIAGDNFDIRMVTILDILSIIVVALPFFALFTNVLVAIDKTKELKLIARDTALLNIIFVVPIVYFYQDIGLAYWATFLQILIMIRYLRIIFSVDKSLKKVN